MIIFSKDISEHKKHLEAVLTKLKAVNLKLNQRKCKFFRKEIKIIGNIITKGKIRADPQKCKAIDTMQKPENIKEMRSFLGLANFIRSYIPGYAALTQTLYGSLKGKTERSIKKIKWSEEMEESYNRLKKEIKKITFRSQPILEKKFTIISDASDKAIGEILAQKDTNNNYMMIQAFSSLLSKYECNFSTTEKELYAIIRTVERYRHYLVGQHFTILSDHKAFEFLNKFKNENRRIMRWAMKLQEYHFDVQYIKGNMNAADFLSRNVTQISSFLNSTEKHKRISYKKIQNQILTQYHLISAHGFSNTLKFLFKNKYIWDNFHKDIDSFIQKCAICLKKGNEVINTNFKYLNPLYPNHIWEVDLIGPLQGSLGENKYILITIDLFTKYIETEIVNSKTGNEIRKVLKRIILDKHGSPSMIYSDNDLEFQNKEVQDLAKFYKTKWRFCCPNYHKSIGAVERANKSLMDKLRCLNNFDNKD